MNENPVFTINGNRYCLRFDAFIENLNLFRLIIDEFKNNNENASPQTSKLLHEY